jgi:NAD(P)-dependent dehydrogenase (short-subunit alcohol dehydrogenase family)
VANAGIAIGGPFLDSDPETFDRVIEVNLLGSIATARAMLPALSGRAATCCRSPRSPRSPRPR